MGGYRETRAESDESSPRSAKQRPAFAGDMNSTKKAGALENSFLEENLANNHESRKEISPGVSRSPTTMTTIVPAQPLILLRQRTRTEFFLRVTGPRNGARDERFEILRRRARVSASLILIRYCRRTRDFFISRASSCSSGSPLFAGASNSRCPTRSRRARR